MSEAPVPLIRLNQAEPSAFFDLAKSICAPVPASAYVYPLYVASRVTYILRTPDEREYQPIIDTASVDIETIGDCKYAVRCKDFNGTGYRVTVMLESEALRRDAERERFLQYRDALQAIKTAAEHQIALNPDALTMRLIASLAKETLERRQ